ncbi:hypothetical protein BGW38_003057 [Lunasporangiospora selenospora]|uniref:Uncharacterized protein n=1 Tax=Lunasporangiospora selenospora TaxID=979761 RepID=A0A9P6FSC6_9FUNG|nr:hypothetical protein BGW38_003057 [Lunasporangiospora selenospora]
MPKISSPSTLTIGLSSLRYKNTPSFPALAYIAYVYTTQRITSLGAAGLVCLRSSVERRLVLLVEAGDSGMNKKLRLSHTVYLIFAGTQSKRKQAMLIKSTLPSKEFASIVLALSSVWPIVQAAPLLSTSAQITSKALSCVKVSLANENTQEPLMLRLDAVDCDADPAGALGVWRVQARTTDQGDVVESNQIMSNAALSGDNWSLIRIHTGSNVSGPDMDVPSDSGHLITLKTSKEDSPITLLKKRDEVPLASVAIPPVDSALVTNPAEASSPAAAPNLAEASNPAVAPNLAEAPNLAVEPVATALTDLNPGGSVIPQPTAPNVEMPNDVNAEQSVRHHKATLGESFLKYVAAGSGILTTVGVGVGGLAGGVVGGTVGLAIGLILATVNSLFFS